MPKRILHIIAQSSYAGVTSYTVRLVMNLPQCSHHIIACYKGNAFKEICDMNIACDNLINKETVSYKSLPLKYFKSILYLTKHNFDIIHYHQGGIGVLLLACIFRKKAIVIHHLHGGNLIGDNTKQNISLLHLFLLKILSKHTYQIAVANHIYKEYEIKIKKAINIHLIKNSVPFNYKRKESIYYSLGYIGRFTKQKGFDTFLSTTSLLREQKPYLNIFVMGESTNLNQNELVYLTPSFDVKQFYNKVDLIIFSSKAPEGLPLVILEAISFDVGVIVFPLKGIVEILGSDYPLLCSSDNELISKIEYFYSEQFNKQMLSNFHQRLVKKFDFHQMTQKLEILYDTLSLQ